MTSKEIKPENVAIVFTDGNTGKAYARTLQPWEATLVLGQLQAIDDVGALKAIEVEPFMLRSVKK